MQEAIELLEKATGGKSRVVPYQVKINVQELNLEALNSLSDPKVRAAFSDVKVKRSGTGLVIILKNL